jgi:hypothetical protein
MAKVNRRKLKLADIEITIDTEEEDMAIHGHFDDYDYEREIIESYQSGNGFAWCSAMVTAKWTDPSGFEHVGTDHLGGISCLPTENMTARQNFKALVKDHGMAEQALEDLQRMVNEHDRKEAGALVLEAVAGIPTETLHTWIKRSFQTVVPLAKAEIERRKIPV